MSNYLFYTLLGYAAGLATASYIDIIITKRNEKINEEQVNRWIYKLQAKSYNAWKGIMTFYTIYDPAAKGKNVISHMINPELMEIDRLNEILTEAADIIREFYEENPELIEQIIKSKDSNNE